MFVKVDIKLWFFTLFGIILQLCASLNINKKSVDRDLDVYRNLLSKLVQAKELLKEYVDRWYSYH